MESMESLPEIREETPVREEVDHEAVRPPYIHVGRPFLAANTAR